MAWKRASIKVSSCWCLSIFPSNTHTYTPACFIWLSLHQKGKKRDKNTSHCSQILLSAHPLLRALCFWRLLCVCARLFVLHVHICCQVNISLFCDFFFLSLDEIVSMAKSRSCSWTIFVSSIASFIVSFRCSQLCAIFFIFCCYITVDNEGTIDPFAFALQGQRVGKWVQIWRDIRPGGRNRRIVFCIDLFMHKAIHGVDPDEKKKKITLTDFQTSCSDCKCSRSEFVQFFVTDWSGFRYLHIYLKITNSRFTTERRLYVAHRNYCINCWRIIQDILMFVLVFCFMFVCGKIHIFRDTAVVFLKQEIE